MEIFVGVHVTFPECMGMCFFCLKMGFEYRKGVGFLMNRRIDRILVGCFDVPKVNVFKRFLKQEKMLVVLYVREFLKMILPLVYAIRSMGLAYFPKWMVDVYGKSR